VQGKYIRTGGPRETTLPVSMPSTHVGRTTILKLL
jgi:hypothetical protein